jgi:glycerol-3-phosphate dehydrogenase (NAD(P)+)
MAKIVILGAGVMGSAFSVPLADNGHAVRLVGTHLDAQIIAALRREHFHPRLKVHLPTSVEPYAHEELGEAMREVDLVILGVNSAGVNWAAEKLSPVQPLDAPIVMLTKGLRGDGNTLEILPRVLKGRLPSGYRGPVCTIRGPSIAGELAVRRETSVLLTCPEPAVFNRLSGWLRTAYYHVWPNRDLIGVEFCAALKNLFSLVVGLVSGMLERSPRVENEAKMHNPAAALFAEALCEISHVVTTMGGQQRSIWMLPGAGDFYVTCAGGRNVRMGHWMGSGLSYSEAKARYMADETIEGAEVAFAIGPTVENMIKRGVLEAEALPLMRTILEMVCHDSPARIPWDRFFASSIPGRIDAS